jgi:hypothetical protein
MLAELPGEVILKSNLKPGGVTEWFMVAVLKLYIRYPDVFLYV